MPQQISKRTRGRTGASHSPELEPASTLQEGLGNGDKNQVASPPSKKCPGLPRNGKWEETVQKQIKGLKTELQNRMSSSSMSRDIKEDIMYLKFDVPLVEGTVIRRERQFIIYVLVDGVEQTCHCPTRGRIGAFELSGRPCLLSKTNKPARRTQYTVEAISLNRPEDKKKEWVGINQIAANRYVEHFLKNNAFHDMIEVKTTVLREQVLGQSKLDFLVDSTYLEVKTPLENIQLQMPKYIKQKVAKPVAYTGRFMKHVNELTSSMQSHQRAIMLVVFMYNNPGFRVMGSYNRHKEIYATVGRSLDTGVEMWQANLLMDQHGIRLDRCMPIPTENIMVDNED